MTLQELLQARAGKVQRQSAMLAKAKAENRDLTEAEEQEFETLESEITSLDTQIDAKKKQDKRDSVVAARMNTLDQPVDPVFRAALPGASPVEKKEDYGFQSLGEFVNAVRFGDSKGRLDAIRNDMSMGTGTEGGFKVPEQFRDEMLRLNAESSIVRSRANVIPAGDPPDSKISMPVFDQGANGVYGGVEVEWIAEGAEKPKTDAKLKEVSLEPQEVAAHVVVTDKLLRNWSSASSFLQNLLRQSMVAAEDLAFLKGDGVGKPLGFIGSAGGLAVNRGTANKIAYADVVKMMAKLLPESDAFFIAHQTTIPELMALQDPSGRYIFNGGDATKGIPATLLGLPIRFTGKTYALGTKGDLVLVDLSYYLIKDGSGPFIAASEHVYFRNNKTVIKCFWNVDGQPWVTTPLTLEDKATQVSPYINLDVPAV